MNLLKSVESTIASLVEGTFGRLFRSEVRPMELARKLAREMDEHRTASVSRVYAPNEYSVWLSPQDRSRYEGVEDEVIDELCAYLLEHARREQLILVSPPLISFHTDERLSLGEFGIEAQLVRLGGNHDALHRPGDASHQPGEALHPAGESEASHPPAPTAPRPVEEHGGTMIYSTSARVRGPLEDARARRPARALLSVDGRRMPLPPGGGTIGRSRACDIVLEDLAVSRRHAEIRPGTGGWTVADLGSTNGVLVNGQDVRGVQPVHTGDQIQLGSTKIVFELG
jgi:FhaA, N-terminal domain/FHA domain